MGWGEIIAVVYTIVIALLCSAMCIAEGLDCWDAARENRD